MKEKYVHYLSFRTINFPCILPCSYAVTYAIEWYFVTDV
jgi:hypothetical protein